MPEETEIHTVHIHVVGTTGSIEDPVLWSIFVELPGRRAGQWPTFEWANRVVPTRLMRVEALATLGYELVTPEWDWREYNGAPSGRHSLAASARCRPLAEVPADA